MQKFFIGLDIGTESVGIVATDENYNILRSHGKDMWAVRLFDEAQPALERRTQRAARRRLARRTQRIDFLQELFAPYMDDKLFFIRLNNSGFYAEDKDSRLESADSLFADGNYKDRDFHRKYPTVFHLRKALIEGKDSADLRFYYLALHHIVKYRGHFLFEGQETGEIRNLGKLFENLSLSWENTFDCPFVTDKNAVEGLGEIALDDTLKLNDKKRRCCELLNADSASKKEAVTMMLGGKIKLAVLLDDDKYKEEKSFQLKDMPEETFMELQSVTGQDFELLQNIRSIYNFILFEKILNGNEWISQSMVDLYNKHKFDLDLLKKFVKKNCDKQTYRNVFRSTSQPGNYPSYIGHNVANGKKIKVKKVKGTEEFYKFISKTVKIPLSDADSEQAQKYILSEIEKGTFLPKILNADNGLFPYQVNLAELQAILKNLCRDFPQFNQKQDGLSIADKIVKIFLFRIPYYVGPLNTSHQNSWAVRKSGKITPWNFDEMVDKFASNEKFIRRMTNKCSLLYGKDVLPKCSVLYQKFDVLNQLNKLRLNEKPIDVQLKKDLYNDLFLNFPKVTDKKIRDYLVQRGILSKEEASTLTISGKDGDFKASMSSYILLKKILGENAIADHQLAEDIILWHTINTDKNIVESLILKKYGHLPVVKEKIKQLKGISSFKDFGRLSKELLTEVYGSVNPATGEAYSIIDLLYETNQNLNEIINNDEYTFKAEIQRLNNESPLKTDYEGLEDMYLSPQVKRGVWQALQMTDEYINAIGKAPDKIFVEVTRAEDKEKKRTQSRKQKLLDIYKNCDDVQHLINELNQPDMTDLRLRSERLYLYYLQFGRCAYTGKVISLDEINTDLYDVDHILPRSFTKDDSIDNKVLVLRAKNQEKTDKYPLPQGFTSMQPFWKILHDKGAMSDKKYSLLTRTAPLTPEDYNGFINRQIVVTGQSAKAVAELLSRKYSAQNTRIVYSKAQNVSDFRQKFDIVKCRETNDLHHARDAYLNVVVGNVYDSVFTRPYDYFYPKDEGWREYNLATLFYRNIDNVWKKSESIAKVKSVLAKNSMTVTRYSYIEKGQFYDQTVYGKEDKGIRAPRKECFPYNQTEKYGGYKSLATACFAIVKSEDKKGNTIKTIEAVPVITYYKTKGNVQMLERYFSEQGLKNAKVTSPLVKIKSLLKVNGFPVYIAGSSDNRIIFHNAIQWYTKENTDRYIKALSTLNDWDKKQLIATADREKPQFVMHTNRFKTNKLTIDKEHNAELYDTIIVQLQKPVYGGIPAAGTLLSKLLNKKELFGSLSVLEQSKVLLQCVRFLKCNAECPDLSALGEGSTCGILRINKNITHSIINIIYRSATGLSERIRKV